MRKRYPVRPLRLTILTYQGGALFYSTVQGSFRSHQLPPESFNTHAACFASYFLKVEVCRKVLAWLSISGASSQLRERSILPSQSIWQHTRIIPKEIHPLVASEYPVMEFTKIRFGFLWSAPWPKKLATTIGCCDNRHSDRGSSRLFSELHRRRFVQTLFTLCTQHYAPHLFSPHYCSSTPSGHFAPLRLAKSTAGFSVH